MSWHARLDIGYTLQGDKTLARFSHSGPLRILQSLYPEGEGICHNIIVHPPGGLVGGDTLDLTFKVGPGAHALLTTPGATRFYRSASEPALQRAHLALHSGARMEWLPLESICYSGCLAENRLTMALDPGAELIGWDVTALGLPGANQPFEQGQFCQHIDVPGVWLERAHLRAHDKLLMDGPLGLAGQRCIASLFFVAGSNLDRHRRQQALDCARDILAAHPLQPTAGATSPDGKVVVVRVLAPVVEPAMSLLRQIWKAWRDHFWSLGSPVPRIWST